MRWSYDPTARYPRELRLVRLVMEHRDGYGSKWEAMPSIASTLGIRTTTPTQRKRVRQAEVVLYHRAPDNERMGIASGEITEHSTRTKNCGRLFPRSTA